MRALVAAPRAADRIELREVPDPQPKSTETVVRVKAVSLNRGEMNRLASAADGARLGWDVSGTVESDSAGGDGLPVGTRVVGFVPHSGWAELVAVENLKLAAIPDSVTFAGASTLPVAGLTALRVLRRGGLLLGRRVLVTGASGGVGRFAVQLAADAGAEVTAVSRDAERAEGLESTGAQQIVHSIDEATGAYDLILESVGGASLGTALGCVALGGVIVTFGNSSREQTAVDISTFYGKNAARLEAFSLLAANQSPDFRGDLEFLLQAVARGTLDPQIGYECSWRDAGAALRALKAREVRGKAVLTVD